jgi:hypothetical protein
MLPNVSVHEVRRRTRKSERQLDEGESRFRYVDLQDEGHSWTAKWGANQPDMRFLGLIELSTMSNGCTFYFINLSIPATHYVF